MHLRESGRVALLMMLGLAALHVAFYYNALPERMATHFNIQGFPDAWADKGMFAGFYLGLVVFEAALFSGMGLLIRYLPLELMGLPHRNYWLSPPRREATIRIIGNDIAWFGVFTCCLIVAVMAQIFQANLTPPPQLGPQVPLLIGGFIIVEVAWLVRMRGRFLHIPKTDG